MRMIPCVDQQETPMTIYAETSEAESRSARARDSRDLRFFFLRKDTERVYVDDGLAVTRGVKLQWQFVPRTREEAKMTHHLLIEFPPGHSPAPDADDYVRLAPNGKKSEPMVMGKAPNPSKGYKYTGVLFRETADTIKLDDRRVRVHSIEVVAVEDPVIIIRRICDPAIAPAPQATAKAARRRPRSRRK
jgi:hypothetical protein